jgi:aminoglycoside phosphotransferase
VPFPAVKEMRSRDNSTVFEIGSGDARWFLRIGEHLAAECARLQWLPGRLPIREVVAVTRLSTRRVLLMSAVYETNPAILAKRLSPGKDA